MDFLKIALSKLDFGIQKYRYVLFFTFSLLTFSVLFSPFTIAVDGFSYLKSSEVLFSPEFASFYTWVREPGYPLFIRFFESLGGLLLVFIVQGALIAFGIISTQLATYQLLGIDSATWRTYIESGIAVVLVSGYASTILQQAILIALFGLLMIVISRIVRTKQLDWLTSLLVFVLLLTSTITAVFIGLAFGLTLFATLVFSRVFNVKLLAAYSGLSLLAFVLVMAPWSQIKGEMAPKDSLDAISMATFSTVKTINNFSLEKEFYEAVLTQAALLNLGGEFPPISGLGIANENRIFGSPVYTPDQACGRFLTGVDPDSLWGKIETSYRDRCVPIETLSFISFANRTGQFLYPLVGLALLTSFVLSLKLGPNLRPIIFPAFLVTLPYILMDSSISRYGALVIPLGAVLLVQLISPTILFGKQFSSN